MLIEEEEKQQYIKLVINFVGESHTSLHGHAFSLYKTKTADRKHIDGHFEFLLLKPKVHINLELMGCG